MWLKRLIQQLPAEWKGEVERYQRQGTFISLTGAAEPSLESQDAKEGRTPLQAVVAGENENKRRLMIDLLDDPVWQGVQYCESERGEDGYLWLSLPSGLNAEALLRASLLKGAAFVPGSLRFDAEEEPDDSAGIIQPDPGVIGLCYASLEEAAIREGMARIAEALSEFTGRSAD